MPSVEGLRTPEQFYTVLVAPGRLAGMIRPTDRTPWAELAAAGYRFVVCLTDETPSYDPSPIEILHAVSLEDLFGGVDPTDPERERARVLEAVDRVVDALRAGDGVIVHCAGGTGRTGTVIGGVLRRLGLPLSTVRRYLDRLHRRRGFGWPESSWGNSVLASTGPSCAD